MRVKVFRSAKYADVRGQPSLSAGLDGPTGEADMRIKRWRKIALMYVLNVKEEHEDITCRYQQD